MNFRCSGNIGDCVYSIPCCLGLSKGQPFSYYLVPNVPAQYGPGINHPAGNVRITERYAEQLIPLFQSQAWCKECKIWEGEEATNLDAFRSCQGIDFTWGHIPRFFFWTFQTWWDLSKPWIHVDPHNLFANTIVLTRTARYRNPRVDYGYFQRHRNVIFLGVQSEYDSFLRENQGFEPPHLECGDFLQMAQILAGCKLYVSNATFGFALAEAMGIPRILEIGNGAHNVVTHGGRDCIDQQGLIANVEAMT